jgi:hypothetical protein
MSEHDDHLRWELLVADAWADPALKKRLLENPAAVLKERGISIPEGVQVKVVEDTDKVEHFVIPTRPAEGELSEEELSSVAGGAYYCRGCERCRGCRGCERCRGCRGCERCRYCRD